MTTLPLESATTLAPNPFPGAGFGSTNSGNGAASAVRVHVNTQHTSRAARRNLTRVATVSAGRVRTAASGIVVGVTHSAASGRGGGGVSAGKYRPQRLEMN